MMSGIILRMSSIISKIDEGRRLLINRGKSKIISVVSKCYINEMDKKTNINTHDGIKLRKEQYNPKVKKRVNKIIN